MRTLFTFSDIANEAINESKIGGNMNRAKILSNLAIGMAIMELANVMREREEDRRHPARNC